MNGNWIKIIQLLEILDILELQNLFVSTLYNTQSGNIVGIKILELGFVTGIGLTK